jgi:hypothetical protein
MPDGRGGRRPGAGRKPAADQPVRRLTVWLTETQITRLRELGAGNASRGLRSLLTSASGVPCGRP